MDDLQEEYLHRGESVLFLEQDDTNPQGNRADRFWDALGNQSSAVPRVIVDSGYRVMSGPQSDYHVAYRKIVNEALQRPPQARISAQYTVSGTQVDVTAEVTNLSLQELSPDNYATVNALVYENARIVHTNRFVRAAAAVPIRPALAIGATATYHLRTYTVPSQVWERSSVVVMVDYQPDVGSTRYDMLQAAIASRAELPFVSFIPLACRLLK